MIAVTVRLFVVAALVAPMSALAAQQVTSPRPGGGPPNLPPHVQAQLWPTRELSPAEQELKTHVTALTDSLTRIDATGTLIERNFRSGASVAMARSAARSLTIDCARAARTAQPAVAFAATLSTSDPKWGATIPEFPLWHLFYRPALMPSTCRSQKRASQHVSMLSCVARGRSLFVQAAR